MKKIFFLLLSGILLFGCASKRFTNKAIKFEAAGYYEQAAEMYYLAVDKNPKNVDAQIGLRKAGQVTLDSKLDKFKNLYNAGKAKEAVYLYKDAESFYNKLQHKKCSLEFPMEYKEYYNDSKKEYLESLYQKALLLMNEEQFKPAEDILNEISSIDKDYFDVEEMRKEAHYEPIYRKGKKYFENEKFRSAYYSFKDITAKYPDYKDALSLKDEALDKAIYTIAISDISNKTQFKGVGNNIADIVYKSISGSSSPFIKITSSEKLDAVKSEQLKAINNSGDNNIKAGKIAAVKGLLSISIESYNATGTKLSVESKKGYLKQTIPQGEGVPPVVKYHKTEYKEYSQSASVSCRVSYKLVSVESGTVVLSDVINKTFSDNIHFAKYDGNTKQLVPGYWKYKSKPSPEDVVKDSRNEINHLQKLLKSQKTLKSVNTLKTEINSEVGNIIAKKIISYDPEKH